MIDINIIRKTPDIVRENIKKKFEDQKLPLVDEVLKLDKQILALKQEGDALRNSRNTISAQIGVCMKNKDFKMAEELKTEVTKNSVRLADIEKQEAELSEKLTSCMMKIPNIIGDDVPIGKDDTQNVQRYTIGKAEGRDFEIPYHVDILESLGGLDLDSARRTSGNGFYYLTGNVARLHSAILSYARDFMIDRGFTYCIPPFMIRGDVVNGVMSFDEMSNMMYKIEGEDLYLIGTSEHSMIGRFKGQILQEKDLPLKLTSYSPCFRKEVGAHGIEERGIYRLHQFEKQEMIIICKPEDSKKYYDELWQTSSAFFESINIPHEVRECCSGDLADLKVKSCDLNAWSPRQMKYTGELGSCSNLGDAQARRLSIKYKTDKGNVFAHTLNNTVVAPPRMLIAFMENNINSDGDIVIPEVLRKYMGGIDKIKKVR